MSEQRTEVKTFRVDYICDECGRGEMLPTGLSLYSYPPQYPHKCSKCGAERTFTGIMYPRIIHESVK